MGRPRTISKEQILEAVELSPGLKFSAALLNVSHQTLHDAIQEHFGCNFTDLSEQANGKYTKAMIKKGIQMALAGNEGMLKFMLGHYAGMFEKHKHEVTVQSINLNYSLDHQPVIERPTLLDVQDNDSITDGV